MNRIANGLVKSAAIGMVVGTAAYMAGSVKKRRALVMKKKAGKAIKTVGTMISDISHIMK